MRVGLVRRPRGRRRRPERLASLDTREEDRKDASKIIRTLRYQSFVEAPRPNPALGLGLQVSDAIQDVPGAGEDSPLLLFPRSTERHSGREFLALTLSSSRKHLTKVHRMLP